MMGEEFIEIDCYEEEGLVTHRLHLGAAVSMVEQTIDELPHDHQMILFRRLAAKLGAREFGPQAEALEDRKMVLVE